MMPHRPPSVQPPFGADAERDAPAAKMGKVFLVGAGPGDPGLLTLRGAECLAAADVVYYDGLANPKLLALAPQAEHICVSKHGSGPLWSQEDINGQLVLAALAGRRVVRLKGGDPAVFARTAEELETLSAAAVPFEVVPGITAALAAASYVGIPITHRHYASAVAFVTGQQQTDGAQPLDWSALARFPGTLVFYMGVTTAGDWSQRLIAEGKSPHTPAAIVRRCTWSDQRVIRCTLGEVTGQLTPASKLRPPVVVVIGDVAQLGQQFNWFEQRPLNGVGIWLTRPAGQNEWLERRFSELGADVYKQPVVEIRPLEDFEQFDRALTEVVERRFQGIALTSRHAVDAVIDRLWQLGYDTRALAGAAIACVGSKTAEALAARGLRADVVPDSEFHADALVDALAARKLISGKRWLLPLADQARDTLADGLSSHGAQVERVTAYFSVAVSNIETPIREALDRGAIQWVTVTSPNMARNIHHLCAAYLDRVKPISLSPAISDTLEQLGWPAAIQAQAATEESLADAVLRSCLR